MVESGALADLRVIDLAGESGAYAGRLFAELGADVIRVEPPDGDAMRRRGPFIDGVAGVERSLYHHHFNAGKRGITLDLRRPEGVDVFRRLVSVSDLLIETGSPGTAEEQGMGYETLRDLNPRLIYVSITPLANDLVALAMSGLMYLNGFPEDPPNSPGAEQAYHMGSLAAVTGVKRPFHPALNSSH